MKSRTEEQRIAERFKKFGVTEELVMILVNAFMEDGQSHKGALIGTRLVLANKFDQHEYFTTEDVAEVTGETVEEVNRITEENEDELLKAGHIIKIQPAPYLNGILS